MLNECQNMFLIPLMLLLQLGLQGNVTGDAILSFFLYELYLMWYIKYLCGILTLYNKV